MNKDNLKFYSVKLLLVAIVNVCAAVLVYIVRALVDPFFEGTVASAAAYAIPAAFFMYFMFTVESRIRVPDEEPLTARYFLLFSLREASVYAVFLLPLTLLAAFSVGLPSLIEYFYAPHALFLFLFEAPVANLAIMTAVYACVAFAAHYIQSKKPAAVPDADEAIEEAAEELTDESESTERDDVNDGE